MGLAAVLAGNRRWSPAEYAAACQSRKILPEFTAAQRLTEGQWALLLTGGEHDCFCTDQRHRYETAKAAKLVDMRHMLVKVTSRFTTFRRMAVGRARDYMYRRPNF